jgi:hypothetical protein
VGITFSRLAFSYWIDNLGFITEGKLVAIFIKPSLGVSNWPVIYFINYTPTSFLAPSSPRHQQLKKKAIERQTQIVAKICQNRTADKDRFFQGFSIAQIKKCKPNESLEITWGICTRNRRSKRYSENFHEFLRCSTEICFRTTTSPNLTSLELEVSLGTTTK